MCNLNIFSFSCTHHFFLFLSFSPVYSRFFLFLSCKYMKPLLFSKYLQCFFSFSPVCSLFFLFLSNMRPLFFLSNICSSFFFIPKYSFHFFLSNMWNIFFLPNTCCSYILFSPLCTLFHLFLPFKYVKLVLFSSFLSFFFFQLPEDFTLSFWWCLYFYLHICRQKYKATQNKESTITTMTTCAFHLDTPSYRQQKVKYKKKNEMMK